MSSKRAHLKLAGPPPAAEPDRPNDGRKRPWRDGRHQMALREILIRVVEGAAPTAIPSPQDRIPVEAALPPFIEGGLTIESIVQALGDAGAFSDRDLRSRNRVRPKRDRAPRRRATAARSATSGGRIRNGKGAHRDKSSGKAREPRRIIASNR